MSRPLRILECAAHDLARAVAWYNRQVPGLGQSFLLRVEEALNRIEHYPEAYQLDFGVIRRAITHRYPYAVYYRVLPETIEVVAVFDCRLDPHAIHARFSISDDPT